MLQRHGYPSIRNYYWGKSRIIHWTSNDSSVNPQMLYQLATYNFSEIVKEIEIHLLKPDKDGNVSIKVDLDHVKELVIEQRVRHLGRCYTYVPEASIRKLGVGHISIQL